MKLYLMKNLVFGLALTSSLAVITTSCSDDDSITTYPVVINQNIPSELPSNYSIISGSVKYTELNSGRQMEFALPISSDNEIPAGTYDIEGQMAVKYAGSNGADIEKSLRAVARQVVINGDNSDAALNWFFFNPENTLVFGEIYFTGTLNAKGTSGLYDTYLTIYNNTDEVQYADGLAIVESKFTNASTDQILTAANDPEANFTAQAIYVIPGSGNDVKIEPGKSIKIVDQAIDWNQQVPGALNHTDADFEWYDETTSSSVKDTDNPSVKNLDKWFSYSATIWLPSNQCNRSYALVRFPEGMTAEKFLAENTGDYEYINAATGKKMNGTKCYLINYDWIIDGVNLCPTEKWTSGALSAACDMSYAAISEKNADKNRFGKKFTRKITGVSAEGNNVLMDTNDSASDFEVTSVK